MMISRGHTAIQSNYLSSLSPALLLKGLLYSLIVSCFFIIVITLLMYFTPLPELSIPYLVVLGMLVSIIGGSMYVGRRVKTRGWLNGGLTGLFYIVVILVLSYFMNMETVLSTSLLSRLFLGFSFGCIGGMLGINS